MQESEQWPHSVQPGKRPFRPSALSSALRPPSQATSALSPLKTQYDKVQDKTSQFISGMKLRMAELRNRMTQVNVGLGTLGSFLLHRRWSITCSVGMRNEKIYVLPSVAQLLGMPGHLRVSLSPLWIVRWAFRIFKRITVLFKIRGSALGHYSYINTQLGFCLCSVVYMCAHACRTDVYTENRPMYSLLWKEFIVIRWTLPSRSHRCDCTQFATLGFCLSFPIHTHSHTYRNVHTFFCWTIWKWHTMTPWS